MVLVLALAASCCYAMAGVLQKRAADDQPPERLLRPALLLHLAVDPRWLLGAGSDVSGYVLQFLALERGSLVLVQPLLVCGVLFALPFSALLSGRRMTALDWIGGLEVVVGLSLFLVVASPDAGQATAPDLRWLVVFACTLVPALALAVLARRLHDARRAVFLGAGAGIAFGVTAALTKSTAHLLDQGVGSLLTSWEPYVMVGVGLFGLLLAQSGFQSGALSLSLPVLIVTDPIVSIVIGAVVFEEGISLRGLAPVLEVLGLAAVVVGVFTLTRAEEKAGGRTSTPEDLSPEGDLRQ